jgi:hypothetical protein
VAIDPNGNAVFVWKRFDGTVYRIQARTRSAAGSLGPTQTLSAAVGNASNAHVGVDQNGNAVFVWQRGNGTNDHIEARARSSTGTLSAVQTLSVLGRFAAYPQLAVDPSGDAAFTWQRKDDSTDCSGSGCFRVQTRARSAAGILSAVQDLSDPGQDAFYPDVAINQSGGAAFVWKRRDDTTTCNTRGCFRAQARTRSAAGVLSAVATLSDPGKPAEGERVGIDPLGNAVAVWQRHDGKYVRIQAATGP